MARDASQFVSSRARAIRPSATLAVTALAARLRAQGEQIISFGAGEPDLETPEPVREAGMSAIRDGRGRYTAVAGLTELREAVAGYLAARGRDHGPDQVMLTAGAKSALYLALYTVLEEGQEVLFPSPHWGSYEDMVTAAGGVPVPVRCEPGDDFLPDPDRVRAAVTPRTRAILFNSPNNPTGAVYGRETLEGLAAVARDHDLVLISDDIYEQLQYTGQDLPNVLDCAPDRAHATLLVNGFSKTWSMTGWRLGWMAGPAALIQAAIRLQGQIVGCPSSLAQWGGLAGLASAVDPRRAQVFDARRRLMLKEVRALPDVTCPEPRGAFYVFPDVSAWIGRRLDGAAIEDDVDLTARLLERERVAVIPGTAFGAPGHIRLTYACNEDVIQEGVGRIARFLACIER